MSRFLRRKVAVSQQPQPLGTMAAAGDKRQVFLPRSVEMAVLGGKKTAAPSRSRADGKPVNA
jgi:hypothetical protein